MASAAAQRAARAIRTSLNTWITHSRLLLAAKTALAVGLAWLIAPLVPGVADEYPYYAPLGALVSMTPTLMGSVRTGLQTVVGLGLGILLAGAVLVLWEPNVLTISLAVGIGMLIAGSRWLTVGGEYVPTAALFVLIIGGANADNYSIGYLVQMAVGIVVGLGVNLLIFPPLTVTAAVLRLNEFRELLARHLQEMSTALQEEWPPQNEEWATRDELLRTTSDAVRTALQEAEESRKANPRAQLQKRDLGLDYAQLQTLETITFHVRDMTDVLAASIWERGFAAELPDDLRAPVGEVLKAVAGALLARNGADSDPETVAVADDALTALLDRLDERSETTSSTLSVALAIAMNARRILAALAPKPPAAGNAPQRHPAPE
ncbi:FUSC family protein [Microterricola pindariensis]|nr:FUSC family protein [Microterricola pindariensis]